MIRNPLKITQFMKNYRRKNDFHCVVKMPATSFLHLTTFGGCPENELSDMTYEEAAEQEAFYSNIFADAKNLDFYNGLSELTPIFLTIQVQEPDAVGRVIGHDGRHRAAATHKEGEPSVEVSLKFVDESFKPIKGASAYTMPLIWGHEFIMDGYKFRADEISEVLEVNIQKPKIGQNWLGPHQLRKYLHKKFPGI